MVKYAEISIVGFILEQFAYVAKFKRDKIIKCNDFSIKYFILN